MVKKVNLVAEVSQIELQVAVIGAAGGVGIAVSNTTESSGVTLTSTGSCNVQYKVGDGLWLNLQKDQGIDLAVNLAVTSLYLRRSTHDMGACSANIVIDSQPFASIASQQLGKFASNFSGDIGIPGMQGFGVGIAPSLPAGIAEMFGCKNPASDNYGSYQYTDGSIMVYVPAFFYKVGADINGIAINRIDVKSYGTYADVASATAAGYALHRAFYNNGTIRPGVFVDKYQCSNNGGIASSLKNGNPLSSNSAHNPFSGLTGAPANIYGGAIAAAKTRGASFFCASIFIHKMLALLSLAHAQASTGTAFCAWYDPAGVTNFPKGCNNNALRDSNDATLLYVSDGYSNCGKTGSSNALARTTHNGQNCGVADLNGNMWEIAPGLTSDGVNYYILKTAADMTAATGGNTLSTDLWGAAGLAALYTSIGATYESLTASGTNKIFGAATQVLSPATTGDAWAMAGAGVPLATGVGGSNLFGSDYMYDARPNELCVLSGATWGYGGSAGVWALYLDTVRGYSNAAVGFRSASYL